MPDKLRKQYDKLNKEWVIGLSDNHGNNVVTAEFAITKAMKLRQMACGFIYDTEQDQTHELDDFRFDALRELIETIPENESIIVWTPFSMTYDKIAKVVEKTKRSYGFCTGVQSQAEKNQYIDAFKNKELSVLICNEQAGGTGLNLQVARHAIWFAHGYNAIEHMQAKGRNFRGGSIDLHQNIVHHHFIVKNSIDIVIKNLLENKQISIDEIVSMVQ